MKTTYILLSLLLMPLSMFATGQMGEVLEYKGETNEMFSCPLESYFPKTGVTSEQFRIVRDDSYRSSACWRCYVGTWTIQNKALYLKSIKPYCMTNPIKMEWDGKPLSITFESYLPDPKILPLKATWFSGTLRVPRGNELRYVHMGFGAIYERDLFLQITNGVVVKEYVVNNKNASPTASQEDLEWVAFSGGPAKDSGDWIDARTLPTPETKSIATSGINFQTRGIFFNATTNEPATLNIPNTRATPYMALPLHVTPKGLPDYTGCHVEIRAHFVKDEDGYLLHVDSLRLLQPGETIHKADYKPPNNLLMDTVNQSPANDPFAAPKE